MEEPLRNKLQKAVIKCRQVLEEDIKRQMEGTYGVTPIGKFLENYSSSVTEIQLGEREQILTSIRHIEAQGVSRQAAAEQFARETAFTILNRLAALKLMEHPSRGYDGRGLIPESIVRGKESSGFQQFRKVSPEACRGALNGDIPDDGYRLYLECLYDDLAVELGVLFDRKTSQSIIFPSDGCLKHISEILNSDDIAPVWGVDETIGWIYQYFTPDEQRKKARKASSAPQNSYELAFRNQFFTPRYIVEFLADNTLGRTWIEMREGKTRLVEECRYLVKHPDAVADDVTTREKKDPRDIRVLDPACGSGHFLLYAYDLFQVIYEEAYRDEATPTFSETGKTLRQDFPDENKFRASVPALILRQNLYGIDIDLRAAQIAALALWLRTQRAYQELRLKIPERPPITRTNIVCAEPMPGEPEMLEEFVRDVQPRLVGQLAREVFDKMQLAGEAGSLLKIEEDIRDAVEDVKKRWRSRVAEDRDALFEHSVLYDDAENLFGISGIEDETFWADIELSVVRELESYAGSAANGASFARRLFADDAVQGFAFLDACRRRYDVVLMNPPFGDASKPSKKYIDETYADTKGDVYKAFIECFQDRLVPGGYLGAITSRTGFFLSGSSDWRERIVLRLYRPIVLADLGFGVLDAMVETAAYVLRSLTEEEDWELTLQLVSELRRVPVDKRKEFSTRKYELERKLKRHQATAELRRLESAGFIEPVEARFPKWRQQTRQIDKADTPPSEHYPPLICIRLFGTKDKQSLVQESLVDSSHPCRFVVTPEEFSLIPGKPFCYWVKRRVKQFFQSLSSFENKQRTAQHGLSTKNDPRFLRLWWEVSAGSLAPPSAHPPEARGNYCVLGNYRWFPFAKGGSYSPFYSDLHLVVNWLRDGEEIERYVLQRYPYLGDNAGWVLHHEAYYFHPGLTWTLRTTSDFGIRALPAGSLFASKGPSVFAPNEVLYLGLLQSSIFSHLLSVQHGAPDAAARSYEAGIIQSTPIPNLNSTVFEHFGAPVKFAVDLKRRLDTVNETSHIFTLPYLIQATGSTLAERADSWRVNVNEADAELARLQKEIDDIAFRLYGIEGEDRQAIEGFVSGDHPPSVDEETSGTEVDNEDADDEAEDERPPTDNRALIIDFVSYAVGCVFGRWDVRLATGERQALPLSDPFDPLPVCSPGMLIGEDSLPLRKSPDGYPLKVNWDNVLVDDENHPDDVVRRVRDVLQLLWNDRAGNIETEACELLGVHTLRDYFRNPRGFYEDHIKRYSKSRRRAPIYWLLQTPSRSYALWFYYPRFNRDTLLKTLEPDGYVESKIRGELSVLRELQDALDRDRDTMTSRQRRAQEQLIEVQQSLVTELNEFKERLVRVAASGFDPDLNDGVVLNIAPFHELTPWAEAKKYWKELQAGKYGWSTVSNKVFGER